VLSSRKILFDQLTPITIFAKLQSHFSGELCFLFESAINNNDGNFSFLFIGARERVIHKDGESVHIDEDGTSHNLGANPFTFLKKRYAELDKTLYKNYAKELGVGFVDGFIGYIGYDAVKNYLRGLKNTLCSFNLWFIINIFFYRQYTIYQYINIIFSRNSFVNKLVKISTSN
jgi:anthranilate synthase component 1